MFDPDAHLPRSNRTLIYLGACVIAGLRVARERQVDARVIPTGAAIEESVDLAHEIFNRVFRRAPDKIARRWPWAFRLRVAFQKERQLGLPWRGHVASARSYMNGNIPEDIQFFHDHVDAHPNPMPGEALVRHARAVPLLQIWVFNRGSEMQRLSLCAIRRTERTPNLVKHLDSGERYTGVLCLEHECHGLIEAALANHVYCHPLGFRDGHIIALLAAQSIIHAGDSCFDLFQPF